MAKVIVEFDTVSKALSVLMDAEPVSNVVAVRLGQRWDDEEEYYCELVQREENKDAGIVKYTQTVASQQTESQKPEATPSTPPDAQVEEEAIAQEVLQYFGE